jgi:hypothetical protein
VSGAVSHPDVRPTPRGSRPDAVIGDTWYLFKKVTYLRLTYQIRLLTFLAQDQRKALVLRVPAGCEFSEPLLAYRLNNPGVLRVEEVVA